MTKNKKTKKKNKEKKQQQTNKQQQQKQKNKNEKNCTVLLTLCSNNLFGLERHPHLHFLTTPANSTTVPVYVKLLNCKIIPTKKTHCDRSADQLVICLKFFEKDPSKYLRKYIIKTFWPKARNFEHLQRIWFGLVGFYCISTIVGYPMPNRLYTYISNMWFFFIVGFYGISNIVGYLMPNPLYTYLSEIYDL